MFPGGAACTTSSSIRRAITDRPMRDSAAPAGTLHAEHEELVADRPRRNGLPLRADLRLRLRACCSPMSRGIILCEKVDPGAEARCSSAAGSDRRRGVERADAKGPTGSAPAPPRRVRSRSIESDHFRCRHTRLSCSAAPIHATPSGRLDRGARRLERQRQAAARDSQTHTVALVNSSARLIEKCLFLRRHRADAMLRFHHRPEFVDLLHDGAIAVAARWNHRRRGHDGPQTARHAGRQALIGCSIADIFDTTYEELLAAAGTGRRAMWELRDNRFGRRYYASLIDGDRHRPPPLDRIAARQRPPATPWCTLHTGNPRRC
jgi:hypothetical protein